MFDLHGKRALITGSTQGIGFAIAKLFHEAGAEVIVHGATSEEKCIRAAYGIHLRHQRFVAIRKHFTVNLGAADDVNIFVFPLFHLRFEFFIRAHDNTIISYLPP